ncbi:MAG: 16S rRNA (guanine(527)-N(7))-methyltransferase RsmG [Bacteroidales bacterium]|nr:16S rRNA (guanine(527)-N(7))-methyltransferase RsmG [Bacteroidales bacterium]
MELILKYFKDISPLQIQQFIAMEAIYKEWNVKINVISRKDIDNLYLHHVLHSLAIAKVISFKPETQILDIGTGGGFPGIPLAIMFPQCRFHLVDSISKKITVVNEVYKALDLKNVSTEVARAENIKEKFHFIVSRAVTNLPDFMGWCKNKISKENSNDLHNGILYLKGGEINLELTSLRYKHSIYKISNFYKLVYFDEKYVIHLY